MADEEEKKKHTLETLFPFYANYPVLKFELETEIYDSILLSQIDYWLDQAKLLETTFTRTQTGLLYMKYCKWRLTYEDFLEFLTDLCDEVKFNVEDLKRLLLEAGVPGANEGGIAVVK